MSYSDLPLVSDLLNEYKYKNVFTVDTTKFTPDKPLLAWDKCLEERQKFHQKCKKTRKPGELVLNSAEDRVEINTKKMLIEYAKIESPGKYGVDASDLKLTPAIKGRNCYEEDLYSVLRKEQLGQVPEIVHIGTANYILYEKGIFDGLRHNAQEFDNLPYYKEKIKMIKPHLNKINPHNPEFENLIVTGTGFSKTPNGSFILNPPRFSVPKPKTKQTLVNETNLRLQINGIEFHPFTKPTGTRKLFMFYEYDVTSRIVAINTLKLENKGSAALRCFWRDTTRFQFFRDILPERNAISRFHFDKNDFIILPGAIKELPVYFKQEESGVYSESWELYTKPPITPEDTTILIVFHANAIKGDLNENIDLIKRQLDNRVRSTLINEAINKVLNCIPFEKNQPIIYQYNEKDIFEAVNTKFNPLLKQTQFVYNKQIVEQLEEFYQNVRQTHDPLKWNLRIEELRLLARHMEQREMLEQKARERRNLQVIFRKSKEDVEEVERRRSDDLRKSLQPSKLRKWTEELENIISKLKESTVVSNNNYQKYQDVYLILCTYFNKVEEDIFDYKERMGIEYNPPIKLNKSKLPKDPTIFPKRFPYDDLPETIQGPQLRTVFTGNKDQPPSELLKDIPIEDFTKRINTYFGKTPEKPTKGAKGKASKSSKPSTPKGKDKGKKGKESPKESTKSLVKEEILEFDPYAPLILENEEEEVFEVENSACNLEANVKFQYLHNLYVIFYENLGKAATCIENTLKMQPAERVPLPVVKSIEDNVYLHRLIALKDVIVQDEREKLKRKLILKKVQGLSIKDWKNEEKKREIFKQSDSSLWSILQTSKSDDSFISTKPISYPEGHMEEWKEGIQMEQLDKLVTTSETLIDPNWTPKYAAVQKDFDSDDPAKDVDLVGYIERLLYATSVQSLEEHNEEEEQEEENECEEISASLYDLSNDEEIDESNKSESDEWVKQRLSEVINEFESIKRGTSDSAKRGTFNRSNTTIAINFTN